MKSFFCPLSLAVTEEEQYCGDGRTFRHTHTHVRSREGIREREREREFVREQERK